MQIPSQSHGLSDRFETLLGGYRERGADHAVTNTQAAFFASLLDGYCALRNASLDGEAVRAKHCRDLLPTLLDGYRKARDAWAAAQVECADSFNLFEVMEVERDEVTHSKLLAWLLDRRIEHGTHAQGNLGFRLFLKEFQKDPAMESRPMQLSYAETPYWVACEVSGDKSRVDIEVGARGKFLIHIENKVLSVEGEEQTNREWSDLIRRRQDLDVPASDSHAIFLTLDGDKPINRNFYPIEWHRIANVLEAFSEQARAHEVKLFAHHYAKAIRTLAKLPQPRPVTREPENDKESIS